MDIEKEVNKKHKVDITGGLKRAIYVISYMEEDPFWMCDSPTHLLIRNVLLEVVLGFKTIAAESVDKILWQHDIFEASFIEDMYREIELITIKAWVDYLYDSMGQEQFRMTCGPFFTINEDF